MVVRDVIYEATEGRFVVWCEDEEGERRVYDHECHTPEDEEYFALCGFEPDRARAAREWGKGA